MRVIVQSSSFADGTLIGDSDAVMLRETVTLPYEPVAGVAAFAKVSWGNGWPFDKMIGHRSSPALIYSRPERRFIYWAAQVVKTSDDAQGVLRLATDPVPSGLTGQIASTAVDIRRLGTGVNEGVLMPGGWVVGGKARFETQEPGYLGLVLFAAAKGIAVTWLAVSQCAEDTERW